MVRSKKDARFFGKPNRYLSFLEHDLATASQEELNRSLPKVSVVFHLAAAGVTNLSCDSKDLTAVNVLGTQKLLAAARDNGVQRFIYIGSCFEYGSGESLDESQELRPLSLYAKTKAEASRTVLLSSLLFDLGTVVFRKNAGVQWSFYARIRKHEIGGRYYGRTSASAFVILMN